MFLHFVSTRTEEPGTSHIFPTLVPWCKGNTLDSSLATQCYVQLLALCFFLNMIFTSIFDSNREVVLKPNLGKFVRIVPISGGGWEHVLPNQSLVGNKDSHCSLVYNTISMCWLKWVTLLENLKASIEPSSLCFSENGSHRGENRAHWSQGSNRIWRNCIEYNKQTSPE